MSASASTFERASAPAPSVWLYGRGIDLCFGYGLGYLLLVPVLVTASLALGPTPSLFWIASAISLAVITPHYGATVLRVESEKRVDTVPSGHELPPTAST